MVSNGNQSILNGAFIFKDESKKLVICKYCSKEFAYHRSLTTLQYHLKSKHVFFTTTSTNESKKLKNKTKQLTIGDSIKSQNGVNKQISDNKSKEITEAIVRWVASSCRPINIVADIGLKDVIRTATSDYSYNLPCQKTIFQKMQTLYEDEKKNKIDLVNMATSIAITCDHWSSMGNVSYLGLTCHLIDNFWMLNSFALGVHEALERHTSDNVSTHIRNIVDKWGFFEKIFSIGTDNGRNIVKAVSSFPCKHLPCFAHTTQLIIKSAIEETAFDKILAKCHRIVGHFKHSPANNMELHENQIDLDLPEESLIQHVVTRWHSMYDMLRRMLKHRKAITVTLDEQNHRLQTLTEREWEKMEKIADVLQPCKVASELLGGNKYVSSSVVLPIICHLSREMVIQDDDPRYIALFKEKFLNEMERRFKDFLNDSWLQISSALDSRFKNLSFIASNERSNVWQRLSKLLESVPDLRPVSIEQEPKEVSIL